jgi:TDG/mug DNA glycosylase family protein
VWDEGSRALVLGTFPSVKSRENEFYYGHPQNRFWRVLAALFDARTPATIAEKRALLLANGVALWDVLASCDITGSADSSIRNAMPNDVAMILRNAPIESVYCNGHTAAALYHKWCEPITGVSAVTLPSTSPANASWTLEKLVKAWGPLKRSVGKG